MAIFRSKSGKEVEYQSQNHNPQEYKVQSSNFHDPILSAVNEAQPFEQANDRMGGVDRRPSYLSHDSTDLKDIFGQQIGQSDMSNPTRSRNERPLDTIRGFEYAITGDLGYKDQLESTRLGWGFHDDFTYNNLVPGAGTVGQDPGTSTRPNYSFNEQPQAMYASQNYSASSLKNDKSKKKKKGLFGKKK